MGITVRSGGFSSKDAPDEMDCKRKWWLRQEGERSKTRLVLGSKKLRMWLRYRKGEQRDKGESRAAREATDWKRRRRVATK